MCRFCCRSPDNKGRVNVERYEYGSGANDWSPVCHKRGISTTPGCQVIQQTSRDMKDQPGHSALDLQTQMPEMSSKHHGSYTVECRSFIILSYISNVFIYFFSILRLLSLAIVNVKNYSINFFSFLIYNKHIYNEYTIMHFIINPFQNLIIYQIYFNSLFSLLI